MKQKSIYQFVLDSGGAVSLDKMYGKVISDNMLSGGTGNVSASAYVSMVKGITNAEGEPLLEYDNEYIYVVGDHTRP